MSRPSRSNLASATYTITELAKEFNITTRTIRFYEDQGLLNPERDGRKRLYSNRERTRLKLTLRGKRLGFALSEIRQLLELFDTAHGEEKQLRRFVNVLTERRAILRQQQRDIEAVLRDIDNAETQCRARLAELDLPWQSQSEDNPPEPPSKLQELSGTD